jgi:hypothetical protein
MLSKLTRHIRPIGPTLPIANDGSIAWRRGLRYTGINIEGLRNLPVELPPIEQQREIVERIQMTFLQIDALSEDANRASDGVTF